MRPPLCKSKHAVVNAGCQGKAYGFYATSPFAMRSCKCVFAQIQGRGLGAYMPILGSNLNSTSFKLRFEGVPMVRLARRLDQKIQRIFLFQMIPVGSL